MSSTFDDFYEPAADASHTLYAAPAIRTSHDAVRVNTGMPLVMRAPGEATGSIALESAIDEMAWACGIDPLAFRLKNYAEVEPITGKPFSSKALRACYEQGAARFGWAKRSLQPRQMYDDAGLLVGVGEGRIAQMPDGGCLGRVGGKDALAGFFLHPCLGHGAHQEHGIHTARDLHD